jgi:hypothetical protein
VRSLQATSTPRFDQPPLPRGPHIYGRVNVEDVMKYGVAWLLGVPGILILAWFLVNHMH